jgi:hypothetical protein
VSKVAGLAVLSSDALSSVAYVTEEILRVLILAGVGALSLATPIGIVITGSVRPLPTPADAARPDNFVTVVLPELVPACWWHHLLHNQRALLLKGALLFKPNTVVTSVPFHLEE